MDVQPTDRGDASPHPVVAPVSEVLLLEDRARVIRRGTVIAEPGLNKFQIDDVAPVIVDKTLTVTITASEASGRVVDCRIQRRAVFDVTDKDSTLPEGRLPSDRSQLVLEQNRLDGQIERCKARRSTLDKQIIAFESIANFTFADLAEDASWGREIGDEWSSQLDELRDRERAMRARSRELLNETEELELQRGRVQNRIEYLTNASSREGATVEIELFAEEAGEYSFKVEYVVPGACWRPYHTARLTSGELDHVVFSTDACVWQNTGEDWTDVELAFSTQRQSLGTKPPELSSDVLRSRRRSDAVEVEAREQEVQTTGLGEEASVPLELPGIDDGGEAMILHAATKATLPSDGRPYRVPLFNFESDAETRLVAMPELSPTVLLSSVQINTAGYPVLAAPVDLVRDRGYVGHTSVLFVAPGEKFEVGWGPEAELRVQRVVEESEDKSKLLSSWTSRKYKVSVHVSNIGGRHRSLRVTERVFVSEIDKVKIAIDSDNTTGGRAPDDDGFITWHIDIDPFGQKSVELQYTLKKHDAVVGI